MCIRLTTPSGQGGRPRVAKEGKQTVADQCDAAEGREALRRPSSTRSTPASQSSRTRSATSSGGPARQNRSSGSSPRTPASVGSSPDDVDVRADGGVGVRASPRRVLVDHGHAAGHEPCAGLPSHSRTSGTSSGFAVPPSLTSSATVPAQAAVRGPHVPIRSGTGRARVGRRASCRARGGSARRPRRGRRRRATLETPRPPRAARAAVASSRPSRSSHAPRARPR